MSQTGTAAQPLRAASYPGLPAGAPIGLVIMAGLKVLAGPHIRLRPSVPMRAAGPDPWPRRNRGQEEMTIP